MITTGVQGGEIVCGICTIGWVHFRCQHISSDSKVRLFLNWKLGQGSYNDGRLGLGRTYNNGSLAIEVTSISPNPLSMAGGDFHSLIVDSGQTVQGWGRDYQGNLGIVGETSAVGIAATHFTSFVLKSDRTAWVSGTNTGNGSTGCGTHNQNYNRHDAAYQVVGLTDVLSIGTGEYHGMTVKDNGEGTYSFGTWGENGSGQLGNNSTTDSWSPIKITFP